ncbi:MAG: beta-N-acetylhexosaminidase, partial [Paludibacter sp.]|nr:beta-N-acetylhexosaminidase [Paludibacter sp.]
MKTVKQLTVIIFLAVIGLWGNLQAAVDYQVIPLPNTIQLQDAAPFELTSGVRIYYPKKNIAMQRNALYLSDYLQDVFGEKAKVKAGKAKRG